MSFADVKIETSGGLYLKIESGKPVVVRVLHDDPFSYITHGFGKLSKECGGEHCQLCAEVDHEGKKVNKRRQRFKLNIFSHDEMKVMIWEFGPQVMEHIKTTESSLKLQDIKILDTDLVVTSTGEGMDKEYSVQPMLKSRTIPVGLVLHKLDLPF